jgi:hypothetical protein
VEVKISEAVRRIKNCRPRTILDFKKAGVPLEDTELGVGVFREVIKVKGLPLVVKFPLDQAPVKKPPVYTDGIRHSRIEIDKLERLQKISWMRKYLPKVYYYDRAAGIIVMKYYGDMDEKNCDFEEATSDFVRDIFKRATGVRMADFHSGNVRKAPTPQVSRGPKLILIDIGY